jgi:hypothetical protein
VRWILCLFDDGGDGGDEEEKKRFLGLHELYFVLHVK